MFELFRLLSVRDILARQAPILAGSFGLAEVFYKFHSFTLECGAFLATWFVLDAGYQAVAALVARRRARVASVPTS